LQHIRLYLAGGILISRDFPLMTASQILHELLENQ
jgi:hypothetical protein